MVRIVAWPHPQQLASYVAGFQWPLRKPAVMMAIALGRWYHRTLVGGCAGEWSIWVPTLDGRAALRPGGTASVASSVALLMEPRRGACRKPQPERHRRRDPGASFGLRRGDGDHAARRASAHERPPVCARPGRARRPQEPLAYAVPSGSRACRRSTSNPCEHNVWPTASATSRVEPERVAYATRTDADTIVSLLGPDRVDPASLPPMSKLTVIHPQRLCQPRTVSISSVGSSSTTSTVPA